MWTNKRESCKAGYPEEIITFAGRKQEKILGEGKMNMSYAKMDIRKTLTTGVAPPRLSKTGSPEYIEISGNKMPTLSGTQDGRCP